MLHASSILSSARAQCLTLLSLRLVLRTSNPKEADPKGSGVLQKAQDTDDDSVEGEGEADWGDMAAYSIDFDKWIFDGLFNETVFQLRKPFPEPVPRKNEV